MYNGEYNNDKKQAVKLSENLLPLLNEKLQKGHITSIESLNEKIAILFDQKCGIDALYNHNDNTIGGVSLRIQQGDKNWRTFTIRYKRFNGFDTEYKKRFQELYRNKMSFYPHYTVQAYYKKDGSFIGGGICLTKKLYDLVTNNGELKEFNPSKKCYIQENKHDGNQFIVVGFDLFGDKELMEF